MVAGVAAAQDASTSPETASPNAGPGDPVVRVTLNSNSVYDRGDRARVFVKVRDDGFVVVLLATPDGRVRPLFPAQPNDPNHIAAGTKFEVRSQDDHEAFRVNDTHGTGMVYVAFSAEPFKLDNFMTGDHWDQDAFPDSGVTGHEEAVLTDLVQQMVTGAHFDYDLATYRVAPPFRRDQAYADNGSYDNGGGYSDDGNYAASYYPPPVVVSTYGPNPWWWGGSFYDPWYDPWWGYAPYAGWGWGGPFVGVGFGFGGGCWGCGFYGGGFYGGGGPYVWHRPGWGVGYHPGGGIGYRGRAGVVATTGVFGGRSLAGGPGVVGYRGRFGAGATVGTRSVGTRSVFANSSLSGRSTFRTNVTGNRAVGNRTIFPQTGGRSAPVPANTGRVMAPGGAIGSRVTASRVPAAAPAGGGFQAGHPGYSTPGYGAGSRAPSPTARRVEPSGGGGAPPFDRTMSAPRSSGGGSSAAPRGGGGSSAPHGGGGGGSHPHYQSFGGGGFHGGGGGGGHPSGGGGHAGGGGGGHHH
jgi:hypothetical protein